MRFFKAPALLLLATFCGCAPEDAEGGTTVASAPSWSDAGMPAAEGANDVDVPDAAPAPAQPPSPFVPPRAPTRFAISLSSSGCYGDCPQFAVAIDQSGDVSYAGAVCTERPGSFSSHVAPESARELYDRLANLHYWALGDAYRKKEDGCAAVFTDASSQKWSVEVDGKVKVVDLDLGCQGVPALDKLHELVPELLRAAGVSSVAMSAYFNCGYYNSPIQLAPSYRLTWADKTLGVLRLDRAARRWELVDCAGASVLGGEATFEPWRVLLLSPIEGDTRAPRPLTLPELGEVGSVILQRIGGGPMDASGPPLTAKALRSEGDVDLTVTPASGC